MKKHFAIIRFPNPIMLWIEPSGSCNLDCPGCPTAAGRSARAMRLSQFEQILDKIPGVRLLNLWHRGEPLVAPDFPEMVAMATRRGIKTQTHSNGILLSLKDDLASRIVKSGLTRISIGLDGADEESYSNYRTGGSLAQIEAGIKSLIEARKQLQSNTPQIHIECLLMAQSMEELHATRNLALKWGADRFKFKTFRVSELRDLKKAHSTLPNDKNLWRYRIINEQLTTNRWHSKCLRLMYSTVIACNGDVLPCCFDAEATHVFGNIFEESWKKIWRGYQIREFGKQVNRSNRTAFKMCQNCTEGLKRLYIPENRVIK